MSTDCSARNQKLKYICRIVGGGTPSKENLDFWKGDIPWVSPKDMGPFRISATEDHITQEAVNASATSVLPQGAVVVVVRSGILRHTLPVGITLGEFAINQDMKALIPRAGLSPDFLAYFIRGNEQRFLAEWRKAGTTVESLDQESVANSLIRVPLEAEQTAVVGFLDRETDKIDDLITKKQRLIELLDEKRAALIRRAVTQGLDPNVPMKDSGVLWMGQVPAQWPVAPLYSRYQVQLGKMLDSGKITGTHLAPYLRNIDIQWDRIDFSDLPKMDFNSEDRERFALRKGDLLVCEGGEVGRAAIWADDVGECYYQKAVHRLRPFQPRNDVPRFLLYVLRSAARSGAFLAGSNQNTIDHLTAEKFRRHRFAFPPFSQQARITEYLDRTGGLSDPMIQTLKSTICLLQEYRSALITAAVTGQLDIPAHEEKMEAFA